MQYNINKNKNKNKNKKIILFIVLIVVIMLFIFGNFNGIRKKELEKNYIAKKDILFKDLPLKIQEQYIAKYSLESNKTLPVNEKLKFISFKKYNENIKALKKDLYKIVDLALVQKQKTVNADVFRTKDKKLIKCNPKPYEKKIVQLKNALEDAKHVIKQKTVEKSYNPDVKLLQASDRIGCYDTPIAQYQLTKQCTNRLKKFFKNRKEAKYYELIGVVGDKDFKVLKDYDKEERIDSTHYLLIAGLSQLRSLEAYWELRQLINSDVNVKIANYTLESTQGKRGFVIRIYD